VLAEVFNTMAERVGDAQHRLEREVDQRTRELRASNAELEAFSYSVSHDLRAPLRAIDGYAHLLVEEHAAHLSPDARRFLSAISEHTKHMGDLIDDLLDFARLSQSPLETTTLDLEGLVRSVSDDLQRSGGDRRVDVVVGALPPARGDPALLRQALVNLIGNALKFTRGRPDARVEIGAARAGGETVYHVRDNGVGFDQRYASKLFGVFERLHRAEEFEGTGVGLALVQRIIQRHGGRVWAEGRVNEGATFYFTLPDGRPS
jgi:light-regulated signal transduction histidine kinase (bacteriophytochrome)